MLWLVPKDLDMNATLDVCSSTGSWVVSSSLEKPSGEDAVLVMPYPSKRAACHYCVLWTMSTHVALSDSCIEG